MDKEVIKRVATLGGALRINKGNLWMYGQDQGNNLTKERLFGNAGKGPLHIGMRNKEVALGANQSDTRRTLIEELTGQTHMTREEAESTVNGLIKSGVLEEINDPTLGKVLVFRGR